MQRYPNTMARQRFFEVLADRLRRLPGVKAVAISDTAPPSGFVHTRPLNFFQVSGAPASGSEPTGIVAWTIPGVLIGVDAAAAAVRSVHALLFQVRIESPVLFSEVAVLMILVAMVAALVPALRAARIDPVVALRTE